MIRKTARQFLLLAITGLSTGAMVANCTSKRDAESESAIGSVGLAIKLSPDVNTSKVDYKITGAGLTTPITGSIAVTDPGATASVLVNGIPAGTGYKIELSAVSTDGKTTCGGSATFDVLGGKTTAVTVPLQCRSEKTTGSVAVTGKFNNCPTLTAYTAAPLATSVGGVISVGSAASDLDAKDMLTFAWSATAGTFAKGTDASTSYTCSVGGAQTLTVKVSDGQCEDTATIDVTCAALACGNGQVEVAQGEQCDPPNGTTCDNNCQVIPVCGNGKLEKNEQCDPPNGTTCDAACKGIPIVCGNSIVQPGEDCDPPNGTICSVTCKSIAAPKCGDNVVNQASEECDTGGDSATCTATCKKKASACEICEGQKCDKTIAGCGSLTGAAKTQCEAVVSCIRAQKCDNAGDAQGCYCGTASDIGCLGGQANGKCKAEIEAAAGSTDPGAIAERFVDPAFPLGRAANLNACDVESCKTQCRP